MNDALIRSLKIPISWHREDWSAYEQRLARSLAEHSRRKIIHTKQGHKIEYDELDASKSKGVLDQIEAAIAKLYSLTEEELDFIANYDIKYRLGGSSEEAEE